MRDVLINICPYAIWGIVIAEIIVAVRLLLLKKEPIVFCIAFVTFGLILDAAIIGLGAVLPENVLEAISPVRFIAHGFLIPLIFPICGYALNMKKPMKIILWIFTGLLMIAGICEALATVLEKKSMAGVVRYASSETTPAWADSISMVLSFGTVIPMMIIGIVVWIKQKKPQLFLSGLFMFIFSAVGPATGNADLIFFISMFGELLMVYFLYLYAKKKAI
jgi:hypothetical protein